MFGLRVANRYQQSSSDSVNQQRKDSSAAVAITSVWKTGTSISFQIKNVGTYSFSDTDIEALQVYFDGVPANTTDVPATELSVVPRPQCSNYGVYHRHNSRLSNRCWRKD